MENPLIIYTDGGARGNPGPAAIGAIIGGEKHGRYIGETTNNVAEYQAMIFALKTANEKLGKAAQGTTIVLHTDSELMARQMMGLYKIRQPHLKPLAKEARALAKHFKEVKFVMVPREENAAADAVVNDELDKNQQL